MYMKIREDYTCPLEIVHDLIKGKWKTSIMFGLKDGPKSLSELEHAIHGISQKMLLEQLKELRQFKLIDKKTFEGYPLHVEYFLTENFGKRMLSALRIMQEIGSEIILSKAKNC